MNNRRSFSVEYKKEIIKLIIEQVEKASHVAKGIDVSEVTIIRWIKEYGEQSNYAFPGKGNLSLVMKK
jgi:transposase